MRNVRLSSRSLTCNDGATIDAVFAGLSATSRYLRFHSPMPRLPGPMRTALLNLDGRDRAALVAEVRCRGRRIPVGIARLARSGPREAELAVAVVDDWHGRGIGERLLTDLGALAEELGYELLYGLVLPENRPAVHLLQRVFPAAVRHWHDDVVRVDCPLRIPHLTDDELLAALVG